MIARYRQGLDRSLAFGLSLIALPIVAHQIPSQAPSWTPAVVGALVMVAWFLIQPARSLVGFAVFTLFIDTIEIAAGSQIKLMDELVIPTIGLITLYRQRQSIRPALSAPRELGVAVVIVAGLASSVANGVPAGIWVPGMALLTKGITVFYVSRLLTVTSDDVRWSLGLVFGVGVVVLALGFVELAAPSAFTALGLRPSEARAGLPAIKSLFFHQQLFGWFCGFIALFMHAHYVTLRRRWMLAVALVFSIGTILSARRRAMIAIVAGLAGGAGTDLTGANGARWVRVRRWIPSTIGTLVLSVAFLPALAGLYQLTVDTYVIGPHDGGPLVVGGPADVEQADTPARSALYQASLWIARDHLPLGAGLGKFGSWMSRREYSDIYHEYGLDKIYGLGPQYPEFITDTFWPQILGEAGIVGLLGYVLFVGTLGVSLWRIASRRYLPAPMAAVALGTAMVFVQTLVESLASPIFNSPPQIYLVMLCIGGTLSWTATSGSGGRPAESAMSS